MQIWSPTAAMRPPSPYKFAVFAVFKGFFYMAIYKYLMIHFVIHKLSYRFSHGKKLLLFSHQATDFHMWKSCYYSLIKLPIFTCKKVVIILSLSYRFSHQNIPQSCLVSLWKYFMILRVYFYSTSPISPWLSQVHALESLLILLWKYLKTKIHWMG